jgi:hypothetical protein
MKMIAADNNCSAFSRTVSDEEKKFIGIDTWKILRKLSVQIDRKFEVRSEANVIKLFFSLLLTLLEHKLGCLSVARLSSRSLPNWSNFQMLLSRVGSWYQPHKTFWSKFTHAFL